MLIKRIARGGKAIPLTAEEALKPAIIRGCKALNTKDVVYWPDNRTVVKKSFRSMVDKDGVWEAWAEGTVDVGRTTMDNGHFHKPRSHAFTLHYKLAKDEWGIPDIALVSKPVFDPLERDPAKMVGPLPVVEESFAQVTQKKPMVATKKNAREVQE